MSTFVYIYILKLASTQLGEQPSHGVTRTEDDKEEKDAGQLIRNSSKIKVACYL